MRKDMMNDMAEMLEATGVKNVRRLRQHVRSPAWASTRWARRAWAAIPRPRCSTHTTRCGTAPNVFVTDGSCMVSSACQNPSLTYMALTARAAEFAVDELKRGNL